MGSDAGQDGERPVDRVWIDSFFLASTQVTNAEYSRFLRATGKQPPPFWRDKNFDDLQQPVAGASWMAIFIAIGSPCTPDANTACPPKQNGSSPLAEASSKNTFPGETLHPNRCRITRSAGKPGRNQSLAVLQTPSACMTSVTTFTNGAVTGTTRTIMRSLPHETRWAPSKAR